MPTWGPATPVAAPELLWTPSAARTHQSVFARYLQWLAENRGLRFDGYHSVWEWSSTAIEDFWASLWDFFEIDAARGYVAVLPERVMPGARWFNGAELNYAAHAFRHFDATRPALLYQSELRPLTALSWPDLRRQVASLALSLRQLGVDRGDAVAACLPNGPEAVVALLASASIGAVWSSCAPDLAPRAMLERFSQLQPRVLFATDGYRYAGRRHDTRPAVTELQGALPSLRGTVLVPQLDPAHTLPGTLQWESLTSREATLHFEPLPFDHPLWVLFSSGTTGPPKAIVHGHGGILLEHLKSLALQNDMRPGDRFFWHTTTGWMMWNLLVGGLLAGCTPVLYDGSPTHPAHDTLWQLARDARVSRFGAGAAYYIACMKLALRPGERFDLGALRAIGSTGSPLPPAAFRWIYDAVGHDLWLASSSGGTDVCTSFLCGCPGLPVHAGELQGPALGIRAAVFDAAGRPVVSTPGELVVTEPMPSMPLRLLGDDDGQLYRDTYFDMYPGVWRHGDWAQFNHTGGAVIFGRSDATLNRHGVRIGTGEIYRVLEAIPEIADSLVAGLELPDGGYHMPLFLVLQPGVALSDSLRAAIRARIRESASPRHVPDAIVAVDSIPRTANGKKMEVPVKRILLGARARDVADPDTVDPRGALTFFVEYAAAGLAAAPGTRPLSVRDARPHERTVIRDITLAAYAEYRTVMPASAWAGLQNAMLAGLAAAGPVERIVAERDGVIVGSVMLFPADVDAYDGAAPAGLGPEVRLLAVPPERRGERIAQTLMDECVRRARAAGATELGLHSSRSMKSAIALYERMGFQRVPSRDFQPPGAELVTAYRLRL